jgi:hypothetical protein
MSNVENEAQVSVDADGQVMKCAKKGLDVAACGYEAGAKICAKCGALPMQMKMIPVDIEDDEFNDIYEKAAAMQSIRPKDENMTYDEMAAEDAADNGMDDMEEQKPRKKVIVDPKMQNAKPTGNDVEEASEGDLPLAPGTTADEEDASEGHGPLSVGKAKLVNQTSGPKAAANMNDEPDADTESDDSADSVTPVGVNLEAMRKKRLASLGTKTDEVGRNAYLCSIERKVYPGGATVCDDCPGGCVSEGGMPGLLHVEGIAEDMFAGKVLDSGYSSDADMFVVDVQAKDGRAVEVFIDGTTAEVLGWHKLDEDSFEQKSALDSIMVINFQEAAEIAVKSIEGEVVAVEPDVFEGFDSFAVEINGIDGKSYDVFVGLDGEVLGYDRYEPEEAQDIEAEAAEIALKRAFTEDTRNSMAKEGTAMSDGSYPIATPGDLQNAISAFGRAKDKEATKRHIMKRARALGQEKMIPANWLSDTMKEKSGVIDDAEFIASLVEFELLNSDDSGDASSTL